MLVCFLDLDSLIIQHIVPQKDINVQSIICGKFEILIIKTVPAFLNSLMHQ